MTHSHPMKRSLRAALPALLFGALYASSQDVEASAEHERSSVFLERAGPEESTNAVEILAPGTNPLPDGVAFPSWYQTPFERSKPGGKVEEEPLANGWDASQWKPTPRQAEAGRAALVRMAEFLGQQPSVQFILEYDLNHQLTMGEIETSKEPVLYDFAFQSPNLFRASDRRPREEKQHWEIRSDGESLLRTLGGTAHVQEAPANLAGLTQSSGFDTAWAYYVDASAIMSLFDSSALDTWLGDRQVSYAGTEPFGSVVADHVVVEVPKVEGQVQMHAQIHVFLSQGPHPVPLLIVRDTDSPNPWGKDAWDDLSNPRGKDTEWRFTDWRFNETS
ncbi:MAG: hypothetical protein AAF368_19205, partial [Planctomycetota bacterium]